MWGLVLVLAVIQGLTEFLPVSSSGHLTLAAALLGWEKEILPLIVALHVGSLGAILIHFFRDFLRLFGERRGEIILLMVGSIPAGVMGIFFRDQIETLFKAPQVAAAALIVNGLFLWMAELKTGGVEGKLNAWRAGVIGMAQAVAILPGISRSGSTIGTALLLGVPPATAVRFSFFLGAIVLFGAGLLKVKEGLGDQGGIGTLPIIIGGGVSCAVSLLAIRWVALLAERKNLKWFGVYCAGLGGLSLILLALR